MSVYFKEINKDNYIECIDLEVSEEQKKFIAPNMFSIAQSKVFPEWSPLCIYKDEQMIGFAMFGIDLDDNNVWISRLMIDKRFQKQGLGKKALIKMVDLIKNQYQCGEIYISTEPDNTVAQKIYESIGFINTGKIIEDEVVFIKKIER